MEKTKKIILIILAAVLAVSVVFTALTLNDGFLAKIAKNPDVKSDITLADIETVSFTSDYPLVQTQKKDLFYEAYPDGTIKYFKFENNTFTEVTDGVSNVTVSFDCSYQTLKVKLYYLKTDIGTVGYGLFNSQQESNVKTLSYVFVRLMDCPAAFKDTAKTEYVLLTDRTAANAYKTDKVYSDIYSYNMKTGKAMLVVSQRDRTAQEDGTVNEGWTMLTDSSINGAVKRDLFASTRINDAKAESPRYCIMTVANSRAGKKADAATVTNCVSYQIREKDGNFFCFAATDKGFDLIKNGDKKKPLKSFDGEFSAYSVSGDWILNKATSEVTNIYTGETTSLKNAELSNFAGFIADESGTKFILFADGANQTMVMNNTADNSQQVVTDKIFDGGICNFCFINSDYALASSYDDSGKAENIIIKF